MSELPLPYLLLTQPISLPGSDTEHVLWICLNLLDHRATAIGLSRDDAMDRMIATTESLNQELAQPPVLPSSPAQKPTGWNLRGVAFGHSTESSQ